MSNFIVSFLRVLSYKASVTDKSYITFFTKCFTANTRRADKANLYSNKNWYLMEDLY